MPLISKKKHIYPVGDRLRGYLAGHGRETSLPVGFDELGRFAESIPLYDREGHDTLWETLVYPGSERDRIHEDLVRTYAILRVKGDTSLMRHLVTDRVDMCTYGNTQPYRVRIRNTLNENFDYFYVKRADASRIYGLELDHILSPNRIELLHDGSTVIEEHIPGIAGDVFIRDYLRQTHLDAVRLAKEFVKFNERCLLRLLGDMHAGNFVVSMTPDLDETIYRIRPIDFDQQSYEGRCHVYLPQYYRENNPIVFLGQQIMTVETFAQYREEERSLMRKRAGAERDRLVELLAVMAADSIAPRENVLRLRGELAEHHGDQTFLGCESMGALVAASLALLKWD